MKTIGFTITALAGVLPALAACDRGPGEPSRAEQALEELQRLVEETSGRSPEDAAEWAREDLERYGDWEYRIATLPEPEMDALEARLNELGQERWEVFWVERTEQGLSVFLKRPAVSYLRSVPLSQIGRVIPGGEGN